MARIIADAELRTTRFEAGAQRLRKVGQTAAASLNRSFLGVVGIGALVAGISRLTERYDRFAKLAKRFEIDPQIIQKFGFAAEQSGADVETLARAMQALNRSAQEARQGLETKQRSVEELGLSWEELAAAAPDKQLLMVADAYAGAEDKARALAAAQTLLGRAGAELAPLLAEGAAGIQALADQVDALTADQLAEIEKFNDAINKLKVTLQTSAAEPLAGVAKWTDRILDSWKAITAHVKEFGAALREGATPEEAGRRARKAGRIEDAGGHFDEPVKTSPAAAEAIMNPPYMQRLQKVIDEEIAQRERLNSALRGGPGSDATAMAGGGAVALHAALAPALAELQAQLIGGEQDKAERSAGLDEQIVQIESALAAVSSAGEMMLGQFRSVGSNERNPFAESHNSGMEAMRELLAEQLRVLNEIRDKPVIGTAQF